MTFTIEQLEEMRSKITPGDRYLHEDDWGDLCVVNDDGRYMNWGDQLVVKIEAGHPGHDGESIVAIPALLDQLIAKEAELQQLKTRIEELRDSYMEDGGTVGSTQEEQIELDTHGETAKILIQILEETND